MLDAPLASFHFFKNNDHIWPLLHQLALSWKWSKSKWLQQCYLKQTVYVTLHWLIMRLISYGHLIESSHSMASMNFQVFLIGLKSWQHCQGITTTSDQLAEFIGYQSTNDNIFPVVLWLAKIANLLCTFGSHGVSKLPRELLTTLNSHTVIVQMEDTMGNVLCDVPDAAKNLTESVDSKLGIYRSWIWCLQMWIHHCTVTTA